MQQYAATQAGHFAMNDTTISAQDLAGVTLVIPAFEPGIGLVDIVKHLSQYPFHLIVVIDDGSGPNFKSIFADVKAMPSVTLLTHDVNCGKGAALKNAFRYIAEHDADHTSCIITLDSDGQHGEQDILAIAQRAHTDGDKLIMGVRAFADDVPLRSRFGNLLTRRVMRLVSQVDLEDTQTGLRCLPLEFAKATLAIEANRYEFELECILLAKSKEVPILQHPIQTIYIDDNASSHFRPVIDSLRIYLVFFRYLIISISSFILDISLFTLLYYLSGHIILSTYVARLVSGSLNFYFNKHAVFRSHDRHRYLRESYGYIALAILIATLSGTAVNWLTAATEWHAPLVKILVDTQLFFLSFFVQRFLIFNPKQRADN
jgi:glycosyltransferase involved in cell wall biosynthesis